MEKLEHLLEWGGVKKDVACLVFSGIALGMSLPAFPALRA